MQHRLVLCGLVPALVASVVWLSLKMTRTYVDRQLAAMKIGVPQDPREIHFVATPSPVVDKMLELAELTKEDVVLDLGCGDGRLVIEAARKFGCRGRGYDIDPDLVEQCKENAAQAGVEDLVEFQVEDIYEVDISDATVVMLYLLPEMNLRLLPQLQTMGEQSRVLTHDFELPGVRIAEESALFDDTGPIHLHLTHRIFVYHYPFFLDPNLQVEEKKMVEALDYVRAARVKMQPRINAEHEQAASKQQDIAVQQEKIEHRGAEQERANADSSDG